MAYFASDRLINTKLRKREWDKVRIYWTSITTDIQVIAAIADEACPRSEYETYVLYGAQVRGPYSKTRGPWRHALAVARRLERELEKSVAE
jgi:hypothetical protein